MSARSATVDRDVQLVLSVLKREFGKLHPQAKIHAYRRDPEIMWVRVVDMSFGKKDITRRDADLWDVLHRQLPDSVFVQIGLLMLLTPEELETSAMNYQFDHPSSDSMHEAV